MRAFAAQENNIDVLNWGVASNFDFLAGTNFDASFAGGMNNASFLPPSPNTDALFLDNSEYSLSQSILILNENFAEFALSPLSISIDTNNHVILISSIIASGGKNSSLIKNLDIASSIMQSYKKANGLSTSGQGMGIEIFRAEIKSFVGYYGGNLASSLIDAIFDWDIEFDSMLDAGVRDLINFGSKQINNMLGSTFSSMGFGGTLLASVVAYGLKEFATEIYELWDGQDIYFGFGGEKVATITTDNKEVELFTPNREFFSWLFNSDGLDNSLILHDRFGNFAGFGFENNAVAWSALNQGFIHSKTGNIYRGSVVEVRFENFLKTGYNTTFAPTTPQIPANVMAAKIALENYGLTYDKSRHVWRDAKGKKVDTDFVGEDTRNELNALAKQIEGQEVADFDSREYKDIKVWLDGVGASNYWELTDWGEIRPIIPLIDLMPWEIEDAFSLLEFALDNAGIRMPFDPHAIRLQVESILQAQQARMESLLSTYDEWEKNGATTTTRRKKKGKGETYPIIYL